MLHVYECGCFEARHNGTVQSLPWLLVKSQGTGMLQILATATSVS